MRELPILGNPDMAKLKLAKAATGLAFLVVPVKWRDDSFDRFLAWGVRPDHFADYAYVDDETSSDGLTAALRWVLTDEENPRANTVTKSLREIFGEGLRELDSVDILKEKQSKVSFSHALKLHEKGDSGDYRY